VLHSDNFEQVFDLEENDKLSEKIMSYMFESDFIGIGDKNLA